MAVAIVLVVVMQHLIGTIAFILFALAWVSNPGGAPGYKYDVPGLLLVVALAFALTGVCAGAVLRRWPRFQLRWRTIVVIACTNTLVFGMVLESQRGDPWLLASIVGLVAAVVVGCVVEYT